MWLYVGLVGLLIGLTLTHVQFGHRRPFRSRDTASLFVLICLLSGAAPALVALLPVTEDVKVGVLALGTAAPFATRRPNQERPREERSPATAVMDVLWELTGRFAERLDRKLALHKGSRCEKLEAKAYSLPQSVLDGAPAYEYLYGVLCRYVKRLEQADTDQILARLKAAHENAENSHGDVHDLVDIMDDLKVERLLLDR